MANQSKSLDMNSASPKSLDQAQKEAVAKKLLVSEFIFMIAVTMVMPTRAPMVLDIQKGDATSTARILGLMSSSAAAIELFINPVFGQLADMHGRKPFVILAPIIDAVLHTLVAFFPKSLNITFIDRMITGSMIFAFKAPLVAMLCDLFSGQDLAVWLAREGSAFGIGLALGPLIGSKLGGAASFFWSSVVFTMTMAFNAVCVPETLALEDRKAFNIAACSPLRFLKLFKNRMLATLVTTVGLQSFGDYANIYDINFLFFKKIFDAGQAEIGAYASAVGVSTVMGGSIMATAIKQIGLKSATLGANIAYALAMVLFGSATKSYHIVLSLFCQCFGQLRNAAVAAYIQKHGQAEGMGKSEIAAAQANLLAVLKVFIPLVTQSIFAKATTGGRNMPGAPYFAIALITVMSQMCFWSVDADQDPVKRA